MLDRNPHDATAAGLDGVTADDLVSRPVGTLHQDVRLTGADDFGGRVLVEDHHDVHALERREHLRPLLLRVDWPAGSLVAPNGRV